MNILVVEDEVRLADTLAHMLKTQKFNCDVVYDGADGLAYGETGIYDCILLDIMLPKMDGFEVVRHLREKKIATPVILLTARDKIGDKGLTAERMIISQSRFRQRSSWRDSAP